VQVAVLDGGGDESSRGPVAQDAKAGQQDEDSASDLDSDLEDEPLGERELEDEPILPAPRATMLESAAEIAEETVEVPAVGLQFDWELLMSGEEVHEDDFKTVPT